VEKLTDGFREILVHELQVIMGYYIRILGKNAEPIPLQVIHEAARPAVLSVSEGDGDAWNELTLKHQSGHEIAVIQRNPVVNGELGAEEIKEFIDEVGHCKPESAASWLQQFLPSVKIIYAFQLLSGTDVEDGWTPLHNIYNAVWNRAGGILQADGEGFSDEDGFTILWQFKESVTGSWNMGLLKDGRWFHFEMDLGNKQQRGSFLRGELPAGVKLI
jgi:hypothetical protein